MEPENGPFLEKEIPTVLETIISSFHVEFPGVYMTSWSNQKIK